MRRSAPGTKTQENKAAALQASVRQRLLTFVSILFIAAGFLFLSGYYRRQIDFIRVDSLSRSIDITFRTSDDRLVETTVSRPGAVCDRTCRIRTEMGSLTRIRIRDRGILVLHGSCDISIRPYRRYFWFIRRGEAAFFPETRGTIPPPAETSIRPFDFSVSTDKRSVDQGRTLVLRLVTTNTVAGVSGSLGWRPIRFFRIPGETNAPAVFQAVQGVDVAEKPGSRRVAFRVRLTNRRWMLRVYPLRINRRRSFHVYRFRARKVRVRPRRWTRWERNRWWRRWLDKKKFILSENRPSIEWKQLQKIFTHVDPVRLWRGRFREPMLRYQTVSSPFGVVRYLTSGNGVAHRGIDYASPEGWPVLASARGRIAFAATTVVRGGLVIIDHGLGVHSTYMHLSRVLARSNAMVRPGERIGLVGSTGLSTGPHLHFGVKAGNVYVDPGEWMSRRVYPPDSFYTLEYSDDPDDFEDTVGGD